MNLLGGFAVYSGVRQVVLPPSCRRVVALAALKRRRLDRGWVCATLWPYSPPRNAVANLRSAMWRLRPLGVDGLLAADARSVALATGVTVDWYDALALIGSVLDDSRRDDPDAVAELLPVLRAGELLDGWSDRWCTQDRDTYRALRQAAIAALRPGLERQVAHYACHAIPGLNSLDIDRITDDSSEP